MGSAPFCWINFTIKRLSNTCLEVGERTGSSGTSLQTIEHAKGESLYCKRTLTRANQRHFYILR